MDHPVYPRDYQRWMADDRRGRGEEERRRERASSAVLVILSFFKVSQK